MSEQNTSEISESQVENSEEVVDSTEPEGAEASQDEQEAPEVEIPQGKAQKEELKEDLKVMSKKLKLKVDGQEIEQIVDLNDEEGLKRLLQKGLAAEKRMSEAAYKRREAEALIHLMQNDPEEALKHLGKDPTALAEQILERKLKEMEMSPEEKQRIAMEKKLAEYEKQIQRIEKEKEMEQMKAMENKYAADLSNQITAALDANPDLPKSDYTVKRIAAELAKYIDAGYDVTVEQILPKVKQRMDAEIKQMVKGMSAEQLEAWLGHDNLSRLKENRKKKALKKLGSTSIQSVAKEQKKEEKVKKQRAKDFFRNL